KSYATVIETVAETGVMEQITAFTEQFFANKEMWMLIISFTICILFVYNIRCLEIDYAREIAVVAGVLVNLIMMTFGYVMMDINVQYGELIIGSIIAVFVAILLKTFAMSVDYSRSERLQFEDDEYYYFVKAVPKISISTPEIKVKKASGKSSEKEEATEKSRERVTRSVREQASGTQQRSSAASAGGATRTAGSSAAAGRTTATRTAGTGVSTGSAGVTRTTGSGAARTATSSAARTATPGTGTRPVTNAGAKIDAGAASKAPTEGIRRTYHLDDK
ncbi:MAG: hypothetical protein IJD31_07685, partial [Lachnospiraceae bacterium]|nr:hypothetical protein [Lachnospiraceae bacterium]